MRQTIGKALHGAFGLCALFAAVTPARAHAQATPLTPVERSRLVNGVLLARTQWLDDHARVDPCSIERVTGDTAFLEQMDSRVRHLFDSIPHQVDCQPLKRVSAMVHVEFLAVEGHSDSATVVKLWVHGRSFGPLYQEYRSHSPNGLFTIHIDAPVAQGDRMGGRPPPRDN